MFKAKHRSKCRVCSHDIRQGDQIGKWGTGYAHEDCMVMKRNQEKINEGLTYRSQRKSGYRRKVHHD